MEKDEGYREKCEYLDLAENIGSDEGELDVEGYEEERSKFPVVLQKLHADCGYHHVIAAFNWENYGKQQGNEGYGASFVVVVYGYGA